MRVVGNGAHGEGNLRHSHTAATAAGTVDNAFDCIYDDDVELEHAMLQCRIGVLLLLLLLRVIVIDEN